MKIIKYKFLSCEINHGTEEEPNMVPVYLDKAIKCSDDAFEANMEIAKREAYNGEVTVEEVEDEEPTAEPTAEPTVWDELDAAYLEGVNGAYG